MAKKRNIRFDLIANASDSLRRVVQTLSWKDVGDNHARLKQAITNSAHAIELLLKERLRKVHPAFVWENVDKYPNIEARTVTVDTAISRLKKIAGVSLADKDIDILRSLKKTRNAIEHYEWSSSEKEARIIIGNALSFVFYFAKSELGLDLEEEYKSDDTWRVLLDELYDFSKAHAARIEEHLQLEGKYPVSCEHCGELTVPYFGGSCELCGHWNEIDDI